jgi:hypothetical protein
VSIIAAAGNIGGGISDATCTFYPAGYYGVLGVGLTNIDDEVSINRCVIGTGTRTMAMGDGNYSIQGTSGTRRLS